MNLILNFIFISDFFSALYIIQFSGGAECSGNRVIKNM